MSDLPEAGLSGRPQDMVERALSLSKADDCIVIADETSNANLRWAGNTLTTNGVSQSRQLTVIAIDRRADGAAARLGYDSGWEAVLAAYGAAAAA